MMTKKIKFTHTKPGADRIHYVKEKEVLTVLNRLPQHLWDGLRAIHFNDKSQGGRILGYTGEQRRRSYEISLCAQPPRFSISASLLRKKSPSIFGAKRGKQWPKLAVRRFILYDVLLHEIGHNQIIDPKAKSIRRKYAQEKKSDEFATYWRRLLWTNYFDHPDPVHNPPSKEELEKIGKEEEINQFNKCLKPIPSKKDLPD
jgi:hypothetical protein